MQVPPQQPAPTHQTWHITFGTYATRLHDDPRPTVDRRHNKVNTPFPPPDPDKQQQPTVPPLLLTRDQCEHIEKTMPQLCEGGGWTLITCAAPFEAHESEPREPGRAGPAYYGNHVHVLLDAPKSKQPKDIRKWLKRWLSQSLTKTFGQPPKRWWAEGGSTKPVKDPQYLNNATNYINRQRTLPISNSDYSEPGRHGPALNPAPTTERDHIKQALTSLITPDTIGPWMGEPNEEFGGLKPIEVIKRGEIDRIWALIDDLRSGSPT